MSSSPPPVGTMASPPSPVSSPSRSSGQRKRGPTEYIYTYAVQCFECLKWRLVQTKTEFEAIQENFTKDPWLCSKRPGCSCEDPADIERDNSNIWVIDKPDIPKAPPNTERQVLMSSDLSKVDAYYVMPDGKRARCMEDVERFVEANPEYKGSMPVESFNFAMPRIVQETVSRGPPTKSKKAKKGRKQGRTLQGSSKK